MKMKLQEAWVALLMGVLLTVVGLTFISLSWGMAKAIWPELQRFGDTPAYGIWFCLAGVTATITATRWIISTILTFFWK